MTPPASASEDGGPPLRVLIVAEHASAAFGGEAALPLHYFRVLRRSVHDAWLVVHARTRPELSALFPGDSRIHYVEDTAFHRFLSRISEGMPARVSGATAGFAGRISTQIAQRRIVRRLIAEERIDVVHQPMPVSPREPSLMFGVDAPVVIGPLNGDMNFPPAFSRYDSRGVATFLRAGRAVSGLLNRLLPGKLRCTVLAVANERTRRALPKGRRGRVVELVENGVDLALWSDGQAADEPTDAGPVRFIFLGRLIDLKAVDLLIEAFRQVAGQAPMSLTIVGDGPERPRLEALAREGDALALNEAEAGKVYFAGWQPQARCAEMLQRSSALVLPSLRECGGAVVLEAMASSRPVIATDWGGPADYVDASCGILVKPSSRDEFVAGLSAALLALARSHALRVELGRAGRRKAVEQYDWDRKVERMLAIYREAITKFRTP